MTRALILLSMLLVGVASYAIGVGTGLRANVAFAFAVLAVLIASMIVLSIVFGRAAAVRGDEPSKR